MRKLTIPVTGLAWTLCAGPLWAVPSGFGSLPKELVHPRLQGKPVPVEFLPDLTDKSTVHVKPTEGIFVSQGAVKSPLSRCDLVQDELKISDINAKARVAIAQSLREAQATHQRNQEAYNKLVREYERLNAVLEPHKTLVANAEKDKKDAFADVVKLQNDITGIRELIAIERDREKIAKLEAQAAKLDDDLDGKKREFLVASKKLRTSQSTLSALEIELAEASGKKKGFEKTLTVQVEELLKIQDQLDKLQEASEKVLKKYSERVGGYATFTADFAPATYLAALKEQNPGLSFQYVPTITATVDSTIPGKIREDSPLATRTGTLILDAKWSDPASARLQKSFRRKLLEADEKTKDPVKAVQGKMSELESSLTGTKFLSMQLSILGYCALREPESLASEFNGGAAETFKLALYYTYPVNYAIRLTGRYNAYDSLYEVHKMSKSSSWFGLSKSQKQEHVRRLVNSKAFDIKVEPLGAQLSLQDSLLLAEKVKEQLLFMALESHLDKGPTPPLKPQDPGALGATTVGTRLMLIPNPWAFWGGLILTSLGEMFGSSSSETIQDISRQSWADLKYEAGFTFLHAGDLTIGDLKKAKITEGR